VEAPQGGTLRICLAPGAEIRTVTMKPGEQLRLA